MAMAKVEPTAGSVDRLYGDRLDVRHALQHGKEGTGYLTTHSTHFIYHYMARGRKEGTILFNDTLDTFYLRLHGIGTYGKRPFTLDTFYLRLYGIGHMVKEGRNGLFNDTLNTFHLPLYGVGHMVKEGNVLFNDALNTFYI